MLILYVIIMTEMDKQKAHSTWIEMGSFKQFKIKAWASPVDTPIFLWCSKICDISRLLRLFSTNFSFSFIFTKKNENMILLLTSLRFNKIGLYIHLWWHYNVILVNSFCYRISVCVVKVFFAKSYECECHIYHVS